MRTVSFSPVKVTPTSMEASNRFGHVCVAVDQAAHGLVNFVFGGFKSDTSQSATFSSVAFEPSFAPLSAAATDDLFKLTFADGLVSFDRVPRESSESWPLSRGFHSACALSSRSITGLDDLSVEVLLMHGGSPNHGSDASTFSDAWIWHEGGWYEIGLEGHCDPGPRCGHSIVPWEDGVLLFGGDHSKGPVQSCPFIGKISYTDSSFSIRWNSLSGVVGSYPMARSFQSVQLISREKLIIWGGLTAALVSDVIILQRDQLSGKLIWLKPVYEKNITLRSCASTTMGDKFIAFGGCETDGRFGVGSGAVKAELFIGASLELKGTYQPKKGFKFKLITVGESGVGKTCLIRRFVDDIYNETHMTTIGTDLHVLRTMVGGKVATVELWDTAGQERFAHLTANYARDAEGFLVVYDATRRASFERVKFWLDWLVDCRDVNEIKNDTLLIGNKYDLIDQVEVAEDEGRRFAKELGIEFIATSAKSAMNVDYAVMTIVRELVGNRERELTGTAQKDASSKGLSANRAVRLGVSEGSPVSLVGNWCSIF
eukprot:GHVH01017288.1.p1 GENE.GHVH01017288.1~~GHVH01017288.1.p1  ORF type:complete len:542 (-),score=48.18 GHVH01017288.1:595-2220(-)